MLDFALGNEATPSGVSGATESAAVSIASPKRRQLASWSPSALSVSSGVGVLIGTHAE